MRSVTISIITYLIDGAYLRSFNLFLGLLIGFCLKLIPVLQFLIPHMVPIMAIISWISEALQMVARYKGRPKFPDEVVQQLKDILGHNYNDVKHLLEGPKPIVWNMASEDLLGIIRCIVQSAEVALSCSLYATGNWALLVSKTTSYFWLGWKVIMILLDVKDLREAYKTSPSSDLRALAVPNPEDDPLVAETTL